MNKKKARKKKHVLEKKRKTAFQQYVAARYEKGGNEEPETLLGNLAPVEQIPVVVWSELPVTPRVTNFIELPQTGRAARVGELFEETSRKDHDLIGFMLVNDTGQPDLEEFAVGKIGMAAQVRQIDKIGGRIRVHLYGICRFENLGFVPASDSHLTVKPRWFEDEYEPEELVAPHFRQFLKNMAQLARIAGGQPKRLHHISLNAKYDFQTAQWASFFPFGRNSLKWISTDEKKELLALTSTAERLRRINEKTHTVLTVPQETIKNIGLVRVKDE